jgi:uncharacterized repeat protein (TIGR01451 family)
LGRLLRNIGNGKLAGATVAALMLLPVSNASANVAAGTTIANTAEVSFDLQGTPGSTTSNTSTTSVDEVLDLTLSRVSAEVTPIPTTGLATFGVPFVLVNTGNGQEAFYVKAVASEQDIALTVAVDVDGNGAYDPAIDVALSNGGETPLLAPGASLKLLVRFDRAPSAAGSVRISASAVTGSGTPGTAFAGKGDSGGDAIVGLTHAEASLPFEYRPGSDTRPAAKLNKSQTVRAPDGSAAPVTGAVITYRLALTSDGTATMGDAEIIDPIPSGTAFVPGSIQIEGAAASDVPDADAAYFDGQAIHIALGEIRQPMTRVVTFQVTIL